MIIKEFDFGTTTEGKVVKGIRISNGDIEFSVINRGATLISVKIINKQRIQEECILGFDNIADYEKHLHYFGATIGRVCNRIGGAEFSIDGSITKLAKNDTGKNQLHGGMKGFDKVIWNLKSFEEKGAAGIRCTYLSRDGEENYPGNLNVEVKYILTSNNELIIEYKGESEKKTPVNLTNHAYWNLSGNKKENIFNHNLQIEADTYLPTDELNIPTGEIKKVDSTPFDFRKLKNLAPFLDEKGGFDHNFNLSLKKKETPENRIYIEHPKSGRSMEILTTEPGVQFYSAFHLKELKKKGFDSYDALCLETQMYPDAVNQEKFQSIILSPGEVYRQKTIHRFSITNYKRDLIS